MVQKGYFNYCLNTFWSLSVEEVFYLSFPVIALLLRREVLILILFTCLVLFAPYYRAQHRDDEIQFLYANWSCFDAIALGCSAAILARAHKLRSTIRGAFQAGVCLAMACIFFAGPIGANCVWGPSAMAAAAAVFVWAEGAGGRSRRAGSRPFAPLAFLGRHSYELYLFHIVILAAMRNMVDRGALPELWKWVWLGAFLAISIASSYAVARWFGDPANRWLRQRLA